MIPPALADLRIGCVSYLNARPLIWALRDRLAACEIPSLLSDDFAAGRLDAALLPIFEILRIGHGRIAADIAIACRGAVHSVFVASRGAFADCGEIYLDPASRSSNALLRVLLAEFYPHGPRIIESATVPENSSHLLIGDPALAFRARHDAPWQFHDLGELWQHHTGLPFVFAAWGLGPHVSDAAAASTALHHAKEIGLAARPAIAALEPDPIVSLHYLTHFIRYNIGPEEKQAIHLFAQLAHRHGLLPDHVVLEYCEPVA